MHSVRSLSGVGPALEKLLHDNGLTTVEALAASGRDRLAAISGIGAIRSATLHAAATSFLQSQADELADAPKRTEDAAQQRQQALYSLSDIEAALAKAARKTAEARAARKVAEEKAAKAKAKARKAAKRADDLLAEFVEAKRKAKIKAKKVKAKAKKAIEKERAKAKAILEAKATEKKSGKDHLSK